MSTSAARLYCGETGATGRETNPSSGVIGNSPALQAALQFAKRAARSDVAVFLTGESGTGKEVFAEYIHRESKRAGKPFVPINCAAIPHDLAESELFGHLKGAFTGAVSNHEGAALQANGGTLFLDEVCEMPLAAQVKLLRFLQSGQVHRVGSSRIEKSDVRIICATNLDPAKEVEAGRFRQDLFYRLQVVPIELPRLADRGEDVLELANHFLNKFSLEDRGHPAFLSSDAEKSLMRYGWPGNVRELQNVLRRVVVLNEGPAVAAEMLPKEFHLSDIVAGGNVIPLRSGPRSLSDIEREAIEQAIAEHGGSIPKAAKALSVSPSTIYRKLEAWADATSR